MNSRIFVVTILITASLSACNKDDSEFSINEVSFKYTPIEWYKANMSSRGVRHVNVPGTHRGDIRGYPVDRKPDVGAYEYSSPTCNEDLQRRIFPYIGNTDPDQNWPGDMNWDGLVDYDDYWILGSWWVNYDEDLDPNTILPYPANIPPIIFM